MEFVISELQTEHSFGGQVIKTLREVLNEIDGVCFYNHPLSEIDDVNYAEHSFLILSPYWGVLILDTFPYDINEITVEKINQIFNYGEDKKYKIYTKILNNKELRCCEDERLKEKNIIYNPFFPYVNKRQVSYLTQELSDNIICKDTISSNIDRLKTKFDKSLDRNIWNTLINEISGISQVIKKRFKSVDPSKRKAWIVSEVEKQLQALDIDQEEIKVGQQIPLGPQRIRGLAGTGKTIILTMKAAYLHFKHPDWNIVYTFSTQSLYNYIESLIIKFYKHFSGGFEPDWEKIKIMHGWGGSQKEGLYSYIARLVREKPKTFSEARAFIDHKKNIELLGKICMDLLKKYQIPEMFDAILMDEAQDFHIGFYRFAYKLLKKPKRLIWAYDELQSLEDVTIPTTKDIFGEDENGQPLVDLDGVYPGGIEKDIVLYKAYRTPRVVLTLAHFFGMGIFRKRGPIQFIPTKEAWEDVGYSVNGEWEIGKKIKIIRPEENSPNLIEKYTSPSDVVTVEIFSDKEKEILWVANRIKENIEKEGILPEEILVIGLNTNKLFDIFKNLKLILYKLGVNSIIVGRDVERDTFKVPGHVTISTVFKGKGNEAQVVYILNFEESEVEEQIIQARNMAFTSMTRTKGWLYITGIGSVMEELSEEIKIVLKMYPELEFIIPDISKIKRYLDNVEYEKRRRRLKQNEEKLRNALKSIRKLKGASDLSEDILKMMKEIVRDAEKGNRNGT